MSATVWTRLAAPFPAAALAWHVVATDATGARVRLEPHLPASAVRARLDEVVGPGAWSARLRPWGDDGLVAELEVEGVARSAAVRIPRSADGDAGGGVALAAAAGGFGLRTAHEPEDDGWVEADPETGQPLHLPPLRERVGPEPVASPAGSAAAGVGTTDDARDEDGKPEAQRVIDRLVERLREEGLGAEAARLVTSFGGYGRDPERSRELYARLRSLLLERGSRA